MKKLLLLLIFAFAASAIQAQNGELYSLLYHDKDGYYEIAEFIMQQCDGDFIACAYILEDLGNHMSIPSGNMLYKISPSTHTITDSVFVADSTNGLFLLNRNPRGDGNIQAILEYHEDCDSTFLRVCHFPDNDLESNPEEDILTPVCEGNVYYGIGIIDSRGDLILQYYKEIDDLHYDEYVARYDMDGTLKYHAILDENEIWGLGGGQMRELEESPLKYYQWGNAETSNHGHRNLVVYVLDSLFHKNPVIINSLLSEEAVYPNNPYFCVYEHFNLDGEDTEVIPGGGDDILLAAKYERDTTGHPTTADLGVVVAKYDLRTTLLKKYIVFNDYPGYYNPAQCLGLKMMADGTVYFLYKEHGYPAESIVIVKMDIDLNVEWKRFCKTENIVMDPLGGRPIIYDDEHGEEQGIAWNGNGKKTGNEHYGTVCFFLNHEGPVNVMEEIGIVVRPYTFYPNPAKNQLHMEFSPDVQPAQVELYDLQGRLVRTQNKDFGSIELGQLPAGTYTMRVILEDGKVYSDKVVKE
jgi:hypothetical protein